MNEQEAQQQMSRVTKFRELEKDRGQIFAALTKITEPWPAGPSEQGPFTANTRESRQVQHMHLRFTATRGGAHSVEINIPDLLIEASELGRVLERMLQAKLEAVTAEIEKL